MPNTLCEAHIPKIVHPSEPVGEFVCFVKKFQASADFLWIILVGKHFIKSEPCSWLPSTSQWVCVCMTVKMLVHIIIYTNHNVPRSLLVFGNRQTTKVSLDRHTPHMRARASPLQRSTTARASASAEELFVCDPPKRRALP